MNYPFKHFLTTLLIGPFMPIFFDAKSYVEGAPSLIKFFESVLETYPLFLTFGLAFALPTFILYYFFYKLLIGTSIPDIGIKLLLNTEAIIGLIITFKLIDGSYAPTGTLSYAIAVVLSSFFFKLRIPESPDKSSTEQS